jgi:hypothetical protein
MRELKELKDALKKSSQAATSSYSALFLNEQDTRLVLHLKGFIRAADDFHASASTTASTVIGSRTTQTAPTDFGEEDGRSGIMSRLPSMKRRQIETYISQSQRIVRPGSSASNSKKNVVTTPVVLEGSLKDLHLVTKAHSIDSNSTFSTIFTGGFSKIAQRALQQLDLRQAEGLLKEALKWYESSRSDDTNHHRHLQTQLALCNLLQGHRQEAQGLILDLVNSSVEGDTIPHQLLYALTLLQLHDMDFEGARDNSKRLWEALQRTPHCKVLVANDAMRLLATSYQELGDNLLAEAIEAEVPDLRLFDPVPKIVDFLVDCKELLARAFGFEGCSGEEASMPPVEKMLGLPIAKQPSSLQMHKQLVEDGRHPMSEYPLSEAHDDLSSEACPHFTKNQSRAKERSWSNLRDFFKPRLSREASTKDLYASNASARDSALDTTVNASACKNHTQRHPSKLRKRMKTSHIAQKTFQDPSNCGSSSVADMQNHMKSRWKRFMREDLEVHKNNDSMHSSRIRDWIMGHNEDNLLTATTERDDDREGKQPLQRQFSFQQGVLDYIPQRSPVTTRASYCEIPDNAVFELMDTSRPVELGDTQKHWSRVRSLSREAMATATSLDTEEEIYNLLGLNRETDLVTGKTVARIGRVRSSASSESLGQIDDTVSRISSGSDSDVSSGSDQTNKSTRRTSLDSQRMRRDSETSEGSPHQSIVLTKSQRINGLGNNEESPTRLASPSKEFDYYPHTMYQEHSPSPLRTRAKSDGTTCNMGRQRIKKSRSLSCQEFTLAASRLCRRGPLRIISRRLYSVNRATEHRRHGFDFGLNNALYSGPEAVIGPFTDLGASDSSEDQNTCVSASGGIPPFSERLSDTVIPTKRDRLPMENKEEASTDDQGDLVVDTDRTSSLSRKRSRREKELYLGKNSD